MSIETDPKKGQSASGQENDRPGFSSGQVDLKTDDAEKLRKAAEKTAEIHKKYVSGSSGTKAHGSD
jgi:hypothetical protein